MGHAHRFDESNWPFDAPINLASLTTKQVLEGSLPIIEVYHEHDGCWQFLCGTTPAEEDIKVVCLGCMIDLDPTLVELADMPRGWSAGRESPDHPWSREEYEEDDPDEGNDPADQV